MTVRALQRRSRSADAAEVLDTFDAVYPSAIVGRVAPGVHDFSWDSRTVDDFVLAEWSITSPISATADHGDLWLAARLRATGVTVQQAGAPQPFEGTRMLPSDEWRMTWDQEMRCEVASFSDASVQALARTITGEDRRIQRIPGAGGSAAAERAWLASWRYGMTVLRSPVLSENPILLAEAQRTVMVSTLLAFSDLDPQTRQAGSDRRAGRIVSSAQEFMDASAREPITIDDVAAAAGVSTRRLQEAFRRKVDATPLEYLRARRLEGARDELRAGRRGRTTVADVAQSWGFTHLGRFSISYRAAFGTSPRDDLRAD